MHAERVWTLLRGVSYRVGVPTGTIFDCNLIVPNRTPANKPVSSRELCCTWRLQFRRLMPPWPQPHELVCRRRLAANFWNTTLSIALPFHHVVATGDTLEKSLSCRHLFVITTSIATRTSLVCCDYQMALEGYRRVFILTYCRPSAYVRVVER